MGILTHRLVQKLHLTAESLQFFQQHHLMNRVARQPVGVGYPYLVHFARPHRVPPPIQAGAIQTRPAVAVVANNVLLPQLPALDLDVVL